MSVEEKAKEKAETMRQEAMPEAVASVSYNIVTPNGYPIIFTMRGVSESSLFERMDSIEVFMKDAGYTPEVKRTFAGAKPKEFVDEKCPKCGSPLVIITTKDGKKAHKCSTAKWDYMTKTASGCDYFKYLDVELPLEPATEKQMDILKAKNLWEEGMTKAKATELISMVLGK
jgi:hypothetical protein